MIVILLSVPMSMGSFWIWSKYEIAENVKNEAQIQNEEVRRIADEIRKRDLENKKRYPLGDNYSYYEKDAYYGENLMKGVDGSSLNAIGGSFAKDDKNVFYKGTRRDDIDLQTFKMVDKYLLIFQDKNQGYYNGDILTLTDTEKLINFLSNDVGGNNLGGNYRLYSNRIYHWQVWQQAVSTMKQIDADKDTFRVIGKSDLASDKNSYYFKGEKICLNVYIVKYR